MRARNLRAPSREAAVHQYQGSFLGHSQSISGAELVAVRSPSEQESLPSDTGQLCASGKASTTFAACSTEKSESLRVQRRVASAQTRSVVAYSGVGFQNRSRYA